jgi:ankyrin repeat protein
MWAVQSNPNPDCVTALLDAGADGKPTDKAGRTAFDYAKENQKLKGTKVYWQLNDARF